MTEKLPRRFVLGVCGSTGDGAVRRWVARERGPQDSVVVMHATHADATRMLHDASEPNTIIVLSTDSKLLDELGSVLPSCNCCPLVLVPPQWEGSTDSKQVVIPCQPGRLPESVLDFGAREARTHDGPLVVLEPLDHRGSLGAEEFAAPAIAETVQQEDLDSALAQWSREWPGVAVIGEIALDGIAQALSRMRKGVAMVLVPFTSADDVMAARLAYAAFSAGLPVVFVADPQPEPKPVTSDSTGSPLAAPTS